jgi:hypothetical protein
VGRSFVALLANWLRTPQLRSSKYVLEPKERATYFSTGGHFVFTKFRILLLAHFNFVKLRALNSLHLGDILQVLSEICAKVLF